MRAELALLDEQLQRASHSVYIGDAATSAPVSAEGWQDYVNALDRGLSELQVEIDRSAERPGADDMQVRAVMTLRCRALALLTCPQIGGGVEWEASGDR